MENPFVEIDTPFDWDSKPKQYNEVVELVGGYSYSLEEEQANIQNALSKGMEIIDNNSTTLTFDLDGEEALAIFKQRVMILEKKGFSPSYIISKSKSGNYHAVVKLVGVYNQIPLSEALCVAIQACLGSDWKREFIGVLRLLNGQTQQVSKLFRPQPLEIVEEYKG